MPNIASQCYIKNIFERAVYNQLYEYFVLNNLLYPSQYGFRTKHSTEDAAIELIDNILEYIERDPYEQVMAIFLDLSKAFNTIDHNILFEKLKHYGIHCNGCRATLLTANNLSNMMTLPQPCSWRPARKCSRTVNLPNLHKRC